MMKDNTVLQQNNRGSHLPSSLVGHYDICKKRNKGLVTFGDMQTVKMGGYSQQLQVYTHRCAVMEWWVNKSLKPERGWSRGGGLPKLRATLTQQLHEHHVTIMSTVTMTSCQLHSS